MCLLKNTFIINKHKTFVKELAKNIQRDPNILLNSKVIKSEIYRDEKSFSNRLAVIFELDETITGQIWNK